MVFFFCITLSIISQSWAADLSSNIMRRVNTINIELEKAEDAVKRNHSSAFQSYIKSAEKEYDTIFKYYPGQADPNHPILKGIKKRINILHAKMNGTYVAGSETLEDSETSEVPETNNIPQTHDISETSEVSQTSDVTEVSDSSETDTIAYVNDEPSTSYSQKKYSAEIKEEQVTESEKVNSFDTYEYSEVNNRNENKIIHSFRTAEKELVMTGINKLNNVKGVNFMIAFEDDSLKEKIYSIELEIDFLNSGLSAAKKLAREFARIPQEFAFIKDLIPTTIRLKGKDELVAIVQKKYEQTNSMALALGALDGTNSPAVMNINNYEMEFTESEDSDLQDNGFF